MNRTFPKKNGGGLVSSGSGAKASSGKKKNPNPNKRSRGGKGRGARSNGGENKRKANSTAVVGQAGSNLLTAASLRGRLKRRQVVKFHDGSDDDTEEHPSGYLQPKTKGPKSAVIMKKTAKKPKPAVGAKEPPTKQADKDPNSGQLPLSANALKQKAKKSAKALKRSAKKERKRLLLAENTSKLNTPDEARLATKATAASAKEKKILKTKGKKEATSQDPKSLEQPPLSAKALRLRAMKALILAEKMLDAENSAKLITPEKAPAAALSATAVSAKEKRVPKTKAGKKKGKKAGQDKILVGASEQKSHSKDKIVQKTPANEKGISISNPQPTTSSSSESKNVIKKRKAAELGMYNDQPSTITINPDGDHNNNLSIFKAPSEEASTSTSQSTVPKKKQKYSHDQVVNGEDGSSLSGVTNNAEQPQQILNRNGRQYLGWGDVDGDDFISDSEQGEPCTSVNALNAGIGDVQLEQSDNFRNELSDLPLADVLSLRDKLGLKLYDKAVFGDREELASVSAQLNSARGNNLDDGDEDGQQKSWQKTFKRDSKKRPREMSSKRPVSKLRDVYVDRPNPKKFDPRFDDRCGDFDDHIFKQSYSFMKDLRTDEKKLLRREQRKLKEVGDYLKAEKVKDLITRMENQERSEVLEEQKKEKIRQLRKTNMERLREGKNPFYVKKSELKRQELAERFDRLKKTGKLDKFMKKKEKKAARNSNYIPLPGRDNYGTINYDDDD